MRTDAQREAARIRLAEIEERNGGRLTPDDVVADAKSPSSPLHGYFEWNIKKAAAAHWIEQARQLITSVHVVIRTETKTVRSVYYVRDPTAEDNQQGYRSVTRLRTDADLARDAISNAFSRAADVLRSARELAVVLGLEGEVETLLKSVVGMRDRFMNAPTQRQ
jgi:hypothetical protein